MAKTCNVYVSISKIDNTGKLVYNNFCCPIALALSDPRHVPNPAIAGGKYIVSFNNIDTMNKTMVISVAKVDSSSGPIAIQIPISTIDNRKEVKIVKDPTSSSQFFSAVLPNGAQLHVGLAEFDTEAEKPDEFYKILNDRHALKFNPATARTSDKKYHNDDTAEPETI